MKHQIGNFSANFNGKKIGSGKSLGKKIGSGICMSHPEDSSV
jgi:hypothetical protein